MTTPPLTSEGRLLWNLEGLLHETFGTQDPASADNTDRGPTNPSDPPPRSKEGPYVNFDCAGPSCSPLSTYAPYFYSFSGASGSAFHLSGQNYRDWFFGNYAEPVLVKGRIVACTARETTFLIRYADTSSFSLDCATIESRTTP